MPVPKKQIKLFTRIVNMKDKLHLININHIVDVEDDMERNSQYGLIMCNGIRINISPETFEQKIKPFVED